METIDFAAAGPRSFWDLSDAELASCCRIIAEGRAGPRSTIMRGEAMRLFLVWMETLNSSSRDLDERERCAALLSGLRKRTIQILVKLTFLR